jgi:hypothetical protein
MKKVFKILLALVLPVFFPLAVWAEVFSVDSNEVETVIDGGGTGGFGAGPDEVVAPDEPVVPESEEPPVLPPPSQPPSEPEEPPVLPPEDLSQPIFVPIPPPADLPAGGFSSVVSGSVTAGNAGFASDFFERSARLYFALSEPISEVLVMIQKEITDNPQIEKVADAYVVPLTAAAVMTVAASVDAGWMVGYFFFFFTQPLALLERRRAKRWGMVINALSRLPVDLAVIRLLDAATGKIIRTRVTDRHGRYIFVVPTGTYKVEVVKNGYKTLGATGVDSASLVLTPENGVIAKDLYLEPGDPDKQAQNFDRQRVGRMLKHGVALVSTVAALFSFAIIPNFWTAGNLGVHVLLVLMIERLVLTKKIGKAGMIKDARGKAVRATVRLFETTYNKLVETFITDASGRFVFLVGPNKYYVVAETPGLGAVKSEVFDFSSEAGEKIVAPLLKFPKPTVGLDGDAAK